jgi:hypothetical protein
MGTNVGTNVGATGADVCDQSQQRLHQGPISCAEMQPTFETFSSQLNILFAASVGQGGVHPYADQ